MGVPFFMVVVVTVYVPAQTAFVIGNGKLMELDAPDLMVNAGVVNITVLEFPQ